MTVQEYKTQLRVGIFMGIGLLAIALMVGVLWAFW